MFSSGFKRKAGILSFSLLFIITSCGVNSAWALDDPPKFPAADKSLFILDTSGSNDAKQLWSGLRTSIIKKLPKAMGLPIVNGIEKPLAPFDITVTAINADSENAPTFSIVERSDAEKMWSLIHVKIGKGPTKLRLKKILLDFFGPAGAYELLIQKYLSRDSQERLNVATCPKEVEEMWKSNNEFMGNYEKSRKLYAAKTVCEIVSKISVKLIEADKFFTISNCPGSARCSDVIGALHRAAASAAEAYDKDPKSRLCIAIASDMVNNNSRIDRNGSQNTKEVVMNAVSLEDAIAHGKKAATTADVKFPPRMIKVSVIGQGSGGIKPDKQQILSAYWKGFWSASGVSSDRNVAALTEACGS